MPKRPVPSELTPAAEEAALGRVRRLAYLLDDSIPIPGLGRVGIDPLLGLIPGVGDAAGAVLSAYVLLEAGRAGAPRPVLLRMAANVAVEAVVGAVPFLGDLFDAGWKANSRNVRLLNRWLESPRATTRASAGFALLLAAGVLLLFAGSAYLAFLLLNALLPPLW